VIRRSLFSALFVTIALVPMFAADFTGLVVSVLDGDTIEVLHNHHPNVSVRAASTARPCERFDPSDSLCC
jgi:endonuclease YncB( thermonuclease family)